MSNDPEIADLELSAPEDHRQKWKRLAPLGLLATGLGASGLGQSTILKAKDEPTWKWIAAGTASLAVLNAGLCLFGDAVKHRAFYEWMRDERSDTTVRSTDQSQ